MRAYMQTHATASRLEFQMKRAVLHVVMALLASGVSGLSQAAELVNAFDLALRNDRAFLNAQAEERLGQLDANRAQLSYLPTLFMEQGRSAFERSNRTTVQAIQPLVDLDKYATFKESPIRAAYAQATLGVKEIDLSKRLYVNYSSLVRSNSLRKLALLEAQALDRQDRSRRLCRRLFHRIGDRPLHLDRRQGPAAVRCGEKTGRLLVRQHRTGAEEKVV